MIFRRKEQYSLGIEAGKILKAIHSIQVGENHVPKGTKIEKKLRQLELYEKSKYRFPKDEAAIKYIKKNINLMCQVSRYINMDISMVTLH